MPTFAAVTSNGARLNKSNYVKKDKTGRFWAIGNGGYLVNIYEVQVKYNKRDAKWQFRSEIYDDRSKKVKTDWIDFGTNDEYGRTCKLSKTDPGEYALSLDETYCLNFRFAD